MRIYLTTTLEECHVGKRLDQVLAECFSEYSRARLTEWIKRGSVTVNGRAGQPKQKIKGGESIVLDVIVEGDSVAEAEAIPLDIVYEDDEVLVLNKSAGLVVHPGAGNRQGTILNALLHHMPAIRHVPRAGIIHRLDKDTTGLMVVAKTLEAHTKLVSVLAKREIEREYLALIGGEWIAGKTIENVMGRHPTQRTKMAVLTHAGKPAKTHFRCHEKYRGFTLLHARLETGRTHQIRVHLAHEGYPIVGDSLYGWRYRVPKGASPALCDRIQQCTRQVLHAWRLQFCHPVTGEKLLFEAPLPDDFQALLAVLSQ